MALPQPEATTKTQDYHYQVDQQVSVNAYFDVDIEGEQVRLQITSRYGVSPEKIVKTTEAEIEALRFLRQSHPKPVIPQAPAPNPDPAAKIALEEGNKPLAQELQAQAADVPAAPGGKEWNIYEAVFVRILPQPDNKATIEFYGNDRKRPHNDYPELKVNKWDAQLAAGLMKHVTSHDVTQPGEFSLNCKVYWLPGKEYQPGKFYKNVSHVR